MPQLIPLFIAIAVKYGAYWVAAALVVAQIAYSNYQRRKAFAASRNKWEASLRDRTQVVRSAEMPRSICYGWLMTSGAPVYIRTVARGQASERVLLVLALRPGHMIDAVEEIYVGQRAIGARDSAGYPIGGPFLTYPEIFKNEQFVASGSSSTVVNLSSAPAPGFPITIQAYVGSPDESSSPYIPLSYISLSGNQLTINTSGLSVGTQIWVQYVGQDTAQRWIRAKVHLGTDGEVADTDVIADSGGEWTSNHRGRGVPYIAFWFWFNENVYPQGLENLKALIRGKRVYDPRKDSTKGGSGPHRDNDPSTWEWSRNPALCVRDFLISKDGYGVPNSRIDDASVAAAANVCDERVDIYVGGTVTVTNGSTTVTGNGTAWPSMLWGNLFFGPDGREYTISAISGQTMTLASPYIGSSITSASYAIRQPRYLCDIDLPLDGAPGDNLEALLSTMAGWAVFSQGKWRVSAGSFSSPVLTLDETALTDSEAISIQARAPRNEVFNTVRGVYVSPQNDWQVADYPQVTNQTYITEDGGETLPIDLTLPGTIDPYMAQRLAKIALERGRQALTVRGSFNLKAWRVSAGDLISLNITRYGFANKVFRVLEREFDVQKGVLLTLREEAAGVYDWNFGEATKVDLAPNSDLASPYEIPSMPQINAVAEFRYTADGTTLPRLVVSWSTITDPRIAQGGSIEIEVIELPAGSWRRAQNAAGDASIAYIEEGIREGYSYMVRARARNAIGVVSPWVYAGQTTPTQIQPPPPDSLTISTAGNLRRASVGMTVLPPHLAGWEVRYQEGATIDWNSATLAIVFPYSTGSGTPFVFDFGVPVSAGTYSFEVRSISSVGTRSTTGAKHQNVVLSALRVVSAYLTSETIAVAATETGDASASLPVYTTMKVLVDGVDDSANWTYSRVNGPGVSSTIGADTGILEVTALTSDTSYVDITASRSGFSPVTKRFTLAKARKGNIGEQGPAGPQGPQGFAGQRGSQWFYIGGQTSWSDSVADNYISSLGLTKVPRDVVTQYGTNFSQTRYWDGFSWVQVSVAVDGNLLVTGTVTSDKIAAGSIQADRLTVGARGEGSNSILVNSDWLEHTGVYTGIEALAGWSGYNLFGGFTNLYIERNHSRGLAWNLGRGGVLLYDEGPAGYNSEWGISQLVPVLGGFVYEVHIKGSIHRCGGRIAINWYSNAAGTSFISQSSIPLPNPGLGVYGALNKLEMLAWGSVTAPGNALSARVYLIKFPMNIGATTSYLFAHEFFMAMLTQGASASNPTKYKHQSVEIHGGSIRAETIKANKIIANEIGQSALMMQSGQVLYNSTTRISNAYYASLAGLTVGADSEVSSRLFYASLTGAVILKLNFNQAFYGRVNVGITLDDSIGPLSTLCASSCATSFNPTALGQEFYVPFSCAARRIIGMGAHSVWPAALQITCLDFYGAEAATIERITVLYTLTALVLRR